MVNSMGIIKIKDLVFEYIRRDEEGNVEGITKAVDDVNLDIEQGDFVAILGHNGSGKSTLAKHMNAILYPSEGTVWVDGKDTAREENVWDIRQTAGMVFQNPDNQIIGQIVEEDVGFGPENMGIETKEIWQRVEESLKAVGMYEFRKFSPNKLSGGQKQRVSIAGVIAMHPKCIVLDEPTAGLDPNERIRFRNLISELSQDRLVLLSTHIVSDIEYIANQVLLMKDGKISHSGTQEEIIQSVPVKVWSCVAANNEVEMWQKQFKVSNMKTLSDGIELRILSEKSPHYNAKEETMTLEDIFLYYFGEKTGDDYDVL